MEAVGYRKISEEADTLSGLPARRLVYSGGIGSQAIQAWSIIILSNSQLWLISVEGFERLWVSPDSPRHQDVRQLLDSFELLEPVLSQLKAGVMESIPRAALEEAADGNRYYTSSPDWRWIKP
jgi:hypothetical protein